MHRLVESGALRSCFVLNTPLSFSDAERRLHPSDVREPTLTIVCEPCGAGGRYSAASLIAKHGYAKILDLLVELTKCPKVQSTDIYDRCKARYEGLTTR